MSSVVFLFWGWVRVSLLSLFLVSGVSMSPFLHNGDVVLISRDVSSIHRFDIVVFSFEEKPDYFYIKRVIGLPHDRVKIAFDGVFVDSGNGFKKLDEPYLYKGISSVPLIEGYNPHYSRVYDVPDGKFFVLGDNREESRDSRFFDKTFVSVKNIYGVYLFKLNFL